MPFAIRDYVETGLADDALAGMVTAATDEVEGRFGDDSDITLTLRGGSLSSLRLPRPALSIESVQEHSAWGGTVATLDPADYVLANGGRTLVRLVGGGLSPWQTWGNFVVVTYTPKPEASLRQQVIVNLVRLETQYNGLASERIGDYNSSSADYLKERERILSTVAFRRGFRFA